MFIISTEKFSVILSDVSSMTAKEISVSSTSMIVNPGATCTEPFPS